MKGWFMKDSLILCFLAVSVMAAGCCNKPGSEEEADGAKPGAVPAASVVHHTPKVVHKPEVKKSAVPTAGEATVNAPPFSNGNPRRGIVRSAPNFQASEVARLDNGTTLNLIRPPLAGGWCEVSWPAGVDSNRGYIHIDVLDVTLYGD